MSDAAAASAAADDDDNASEGTEVDAWLASLPSPPPPLPPLFPLPAPLPAQRHPCHETCSGWLSTRAVLPLISEVIGGGDRDDQRQRLETYTRLLRILEREERTSSTPAALKCAAQSAKLKQGSQPIGICALLPQLFSRIERDLWRHSAEEDEDEESPSDTDEVLLSSFSPAIPIREDVPMEIDEEVENFAASSPASDTTSAAVAPLSGLSDLAAQRIDSTAAASPDSATPAVADNVPGWVAPTPTLRGQLHATLLRLLHFFLRDSHFSEAFIVRSFDAEATMHWIIDRLHQSGLEDERDEAPGGASELVGLACQLLSHHNLPWSFYLSFLPAVLTACQACIIRLAAPSTPLARTLHLLPHVLHLLASIWSRGYQLFLLHEAPDGAITHAALETRVVDLYQQCVSMTVRMDWSSKLLADAPASSTATATKLHTYALHLITLWPRPQRFHHLVTPINAAGLTPLVDAADAATGTSLPLPAAVLVAPSAYALPTSCSPGMSPADQLFLQLSLQERETLRSRIRSVEELHQRACEDDARRDEERRQARKRHHETQSGSTVVLTPTTASRLAASSVAAAGHHITSSDSSPMTPSSPSPTNEAPLTHPTGAALAETAPSFLADATLPQFDFDALLRTSPLSATERQYLTSLLASVTLFQSVAEIDVKAIRQLRTLLAPELRRVRTSLSKAIAKRGEEEILANRARALAQSRAAFDAVRQQSLTFCPITRHVPSATTTVMPLQSTKADAPERGLNGVITDHDPRLNNQTLPPLPTPRSHSSAASSENGPQFGGVATSVGLDALVAEEIAAGAAEAPAAATSSQPILYDWVGQVRQTVFARRTYEQRLNEAPIPLLAESLCYQQPLPGSTYYTTLRSNVHKADESNLEFLPYFGDEAKIDQMLDASMYANLKHPGVKHESNSDENADTPTTMDEDDSPDSSVVDANSSRPTKGSSRKQASFNRRRDIVRTITEDDGEGVEEMEHDPVRDATLRYVMHAYGDSSSSDTAICVPPLLVRLLAEDNNVSVPSLARRLRELTPAPSIAPFEPMVRNPLDTFQKLWCRRCFIYDCQRHGLNQPRACSDLVLPTMHTAIKRTIPDQATMLQMQQKRQKLDEEATAMTTAAVDESAFEPCSDGCFLRSSVQQAASFSSPPVIIRSLVESNEPAAAPLARSTSSSSSFLTTFVSSLFGVQRATAAISPSSSDTSTPDPNGESPTTAPVDQSTTEARPWSHSEQSMLRSVYFVATSVLNSVSRQNPAPERMGALDPAPPAALYCRIARMMGPQRSCKEIADYCRMVEPHLASHGQEWLAQVAAASASPATAISPTLTSAGGKWSKADFEYRYLAIARQYRNIAVSIRPCDHPAGTECGPECVCMQSDLFCEVSCGCPPSCVNRYKGCRCVASRCQTKTCSCFQAQRECDPDLCRSCGAEKELDLTLHEEELKKVAQEGTPAPHRCGNVSLRRNTFRPLILGRSATHGWGAFARCALEKDRHVTEYTGELISHEEADRRGRIYDHRNRSFLFNLSEDLVVDAARKGNRIRFANHAEKEQANCYTRIVSARGDHRIAVVTRKKIQVGEELLFDYAHDHDKKWNERSHAPSWFKRGDEKSADLTKASSSTTSHRKAATH